ncbi:MAG: lipid A biosynthesis acyltransferase [Pseudomonadota bacterium]|nr:lipid A biosynthesis acyltransferase [Pseudomonadota bacterium]
MLMRLAIALLWLIQWLPQRAINGLAAVLAPLVRRTRAARTARINLRLCFPELAEPARAHLEGAYFRALVRSFLELGFVWFASPARIRERVKFRGMDNYHAVADGPVIWLAMHAVGLEMAGARIGLDFRGVGFFTPHKNPVLDRVIRHARDRLGDVVMVDRRDGLRPLVRAVRDGRRLYFLPDMDFGERDSIFVPFFGIPAATVTTLPRLVRLTGARVLPCVVSQLPGSGGYEIEFLPAWQDFPGADLEGDVRRMSAFVEEQVRRRPDQYFWGHKRFRTRPDPAQASPYA